MMKLRAQVGKNLECGDLSPLLPLCDLSPKQGRVQRPGRVGRLPTFDGDKSPAESAYKSAHSKVIAASPRWKFPMRSRDAQLRVLPADPLPLFRRPAFEFGPDFVPDT